MINISKLDEYTLNKFTELLNTHIIKRNKRFIIGYINKSDLIIEKSLEELKKNNIQDFDKNVYHIEFHQKNNYFNKKKGSNNFMWHTDDKAVTKYNVYTIIFYLRKDYSVKGGDFKYKINNNEFIHIVKMGDVLSFKGDIIHKPTETYGFGCRDSIIVFIKRI